MSDPEIPQTIEQELMIQLGEAGKKRQSRHDATALQMSLELRKKAQAEHLIIPYLKANFEIMNCSQDQFEPELASDAAVRCIGLLESIEQARSFQPNYSEQAYNYYVQWLSACSYDNLATATAFTSGYNSAGMQSCIADGVSVCKRTGKSECITCFREYATEVFRAADDLPMALSHARANLARKNPRSDRRWVSARAEAELLMLQGDLTGALAAAKNAASLIETYWSRTSAVQRTRSQLREIFLLSGIDDQTDAIVPAGETLPREENFDTAYRDDLNLALGLSIQGDHAAVVKILTYWDEFFIGKKCLSFWFETQLRLIAAHLLSGSTDLASTLYAPLYEAAKKANDYLTIRRLSLLKSGEFPVSPMPPTAAFDIGPYAPKKSSRVSASAPTTSQTSARDATPPAPELKAKLDPLVDLLLRQPAMTGAPPSPDDIAVAIAGLLPIDPATATVPGAARSLLMLAIAVADSPHAKPRLWEWAKAVAARFPRDGEIVGMIADLGRMLTLRKENPLKQPGETEIEELYRESMSLAPDSAGVFARAGFYFLDHHNDAEGERCLSRAFRLDRGVERVADALATIYERSNRLEDGLFVRDLAIRQGVHSRRMLWLAAMEALQLRRSRQAVSYLDRLEELFAGLPAVQFNRALALLDLNEPAEALAALELETPRVKGALFHVESARAMASSKQKDEPATMAAIESALAIPFRTIDNLRDGEIRDGLSRLLRAAQALSDKSHAAMVELRCHQSGLYPSAFLLFRRLQNKKTTGLAHFECALTQPLDASWAGSKACLAAQTEWKSYRVNIGVLAADEKEASNTALLWQSQAGGLPATIESIRQTRGGFTDFPGITEYGPREGTGQS
jgi:hypothetical protein